ncbi:MAG TPA: hypothetical protein VFA49_13055 [Chloroflexota bacterium]|jgi:hypothetical protein|nr:hypothetical protein [Chloroflexota bacterium]
MAKKPTPKRRGGEVARLQRRAQQVLNEADELDSGGERPNRRSKLNRRPLRIRVSRRLRRKHPLLAGVAYLVIGALGVSGKGAAWTTGKAAKGATWTAGRAATSVKTKAATLRLVRSVEDGAVLSPEHAHVVLRRSRRQICACGTTYRSVELLTQHYLEAHANEAPAKVKPRPTPKIARGATARNSGKVIVLPVDTKPTRSRTRPTGRHRPGNLANPQPSLALIAHYRQQLNQAGKRATTMDGPSRTIANGFKAFGDQPAPRFLSDLRDAMAGLEQALNAGSQGVESYGKTLRRKRISSEVVNPRLVKLQEALELAAAHAAGLIADVEVAYNLHIRAAAGGGLTAPDPEFFSKTG